MSHRDELESAVAALRKESEEGLTAIALVDTAAAVERVRSIVNFADFVDPDLATVYQVCCELSDAGIANDRHAVGAELLKRGCTQKLGIDFLQRLISRNYAAANAEYYARNVARLSRLRKVFRAAGRVLDRELDAQAEPEDLLSMFEAATQGLMTAEDAGLVRFADAVQETLDAHSAVITNGQRLGFQTGFPTLDDITGGFHRGQLILLGGRTFAGKTALALSFASYFASNKSPRPVLFFSLEMTRQELAERILADDCGFELRKFTQCKLDRSDINSLSQLIPSYAEWPLTFSDCAIESTRTIRAKAKLLKASSKLDLIVVDNLQLIKPLDYKQEKRLQLTGITNDLKRLAKELDCVVLLLCQLNADAIGKEPDDRHYAESKQILADADIAMLAHRSDQASKDFLIKVTKNRRGAQGRVVLQFDGAYQRFTEPSPHVAESAGCEWTGN